MHAAHADAIVLGCTHYAFLAPAIREIAEPDVLVIDSADAVARQLARRLQEAARLASPAAAATVTFQSNDRTGIAPRVMRALWGSTVNVAPFDGEATRAPLRSLGFAP